jgi:hypothetical protein
MKGLRCQLLPDPAWCVCVWCGVLVGGGGGELSDRCGTLMSGATLLSPPRTWQSPQRLVCGYLRCVFPGFPVPNGAPSGHPEWPVLEAEPRVRCFSVWQKREELSRLAVTAAVAVGGIAGQSGRGSKLGAPFDQRVERIEHTGSLFTRPTYLDLVARTSCVDRIVHSRTVKQMK